MWETRAINEVVTHCRSFLATVRFSQHGDKLEGATYPNVDRWREELKDRPAVRKGYLVCKKE